MKSLLLGPLAPASGERARERGRSLQGAHHLLVAVLVVLLVATPTSAQPRVKTARRAKPGFQIPKPKTNATQPAPAAAVPDPIVAAAPEGTTDAALLAQAKGRLEKEFAALNRQLEADGKPRLPDPATDAPRAMIDAANYGMYYVNGQSRVLTMHLLVENPGSDALTITRDDVVAKIDGEAVALANVENAPQFSFQYGSQHQVLQNEHQLREMKVPGRGVAAAWLVYPNLPMSSDVPPISVSIKLPGRTIELDVTESQRALLNLNVESLGPRNCLRLLTVRGMLNSINVQSLVATLEQLNQKQIVRYVIEWSPESIAPDHQISQWLVQSTMQMGTGVPVNEQLPALPATIRELHLVPLAGHNFPTTDPYGRSSGGLKLHASLSDAVGAALKSAYLALSPAELQSAIQQGHPLARAAALRHGAARLSGDGLAVVLPRLDDENPDIREAAVRALSQFGEPEALQTLVELANEPTDPHSQAAVESLASSRFAGAQAQLLTLLRTSEGDAKRQLMRVLAKYPRPQWAEEIYAYVVDPSEKLPVEGVRALLQVGHPKLVDVLEACLKSENAEARELAFPILAQRSDVRSERLATDYAMAQLEKQPPDGNVTQFLYRTKLPQSLPPLLKHLEAASDKSQILNLLGQIGNDASAEAVAERYPKLQNGEKGIALNTLRMLRYPKFHEFAAEALLTNDGNMVSQATQGLMQDGGPEATRLLVAALEKQTHQFAINQICNALGNMGSPEARAALLKARESDNQQRKMMAINALQNLYQRSPGYQYIWQAQEPMRRHQWNEAIEFFDMSLEIDPELPEALAGRGIARHRQGKKEDAVKDLERAYALDPHNHLAIPGLAVIRIQAGKLDEGVKILTADRERLQHDQFFLYYSAGAFAQAFDQARQQQDLPDRDQRIEEYRTKAVAELQLAVSRGWGDLELARDDPDLKPLKDDPEFKKLIGNRPAPKDNDQPADAIQP